MPEPITIQPSDPPETTLSSDAELAAAFETKSPAQQVEEQQKQVGQESVDSNPDSSRSDAGTPPSRTAETPSREELLANLTMDEVKNLEHLRPALKSEVDREAARQLQGKTKEIEDRVRAEVTTEYWRKHFDDMDKDELSELITRDPEARALYARVSTPPPPTTNPDQAQSLINFYSNIIQTTNARVQTLPDADKARLDPETFAKANPDMGPEELIAKWQGEIVEAEVAVKLAAEKNKTDTTDQESKRIDQRAQETAPGALMEQGKGTAGVLPDYGTRSDLLLEHAFASTAVNRR